MSSRSCSPNNCDPEDSGSHAGHSLLLNAPIGICTFKPEGRLLSANRYFSSILGYDNPAALKDAVTDISTEIFVDSRDWKNVFSRLARHGRVFNHECRFRRLDGSEAWVSINARLIPHENSETHYCQAFITDITDRIEKEQRLIENEERLTTAIAAIEEGVWDWNIQNNTTYFDPGYFLVAGYEPDEFAHTYQEWEKRLHPEDVEPCKEAIADHLAGKTEKLDMEFRFRHKHGGWLWIRGRGRVVQRDQYGNSLRMVGTHTDISVRKKAEKALLESEERFFKAFNSSPAAQVISDIYTGTIIDVNSRCLELTGYTREELIGWDARKIPIWSSPAERDRIIQKLKHKKYFKDEPIEFKTRKGETIIALWSAESATLGGRKVILSMFYDDTQRRKAEEKLKDSEERYKYLLQSTGRMQSFQNIIGRSRKMQHIFALIQQIAGVDTTVLVTGETGTGKELIVDACPEPSKSGTADQSQLPYPFRRTSGKRAFRTCPRCFYRSLFRQDRQGGGSRRRHAFSG